MSTLVQRTKQVISAENDDFFRGETILYYLNKSKRRVVSHMTQQELRPTIRVGEQVVEGAKRSLRALDGLRGIDEITLGSFDEQGKRFVGQAPFPTDLSQILYLRYNNKTVMRELNSQELHLLEWGNLVPTVYEGYYYVTEDTGKKFELYLHEDGENNDLIVFYVKNPSVIEMEDETFSDIPEQLENAVIYGAAMMMIGQESVKDPEGNVQSIMQIYQQELESAVF